MAEGEAEVFLRHASPDGALTWLVERYVNDKGETDFAFGFEESDWHLHPDLVRADGRHREQIVRDLADDLLSDRFVITVSTYKGRVFLNLLTELEIEIDRLDQNEKVTLRFWSGRSVTFEELIDGSVQYTPLPI